MQEEKLASNLEGVLLVIDDEEEVTKSLKRVFRKRYKVRTATSAEEGLDIMEDVAVHVVISDQRMPGMKGTEFFKKVIDRHPKAVRMILTGYSDLESVVDAINEGQVYRYITKPWEPDQLTAIVKDSFDRYRLQAENDRLMKELELANEMLEKRVVERTAALANAKDRIAANEARYRLIFEHSPLGIFHFDENGLLTACNPKMIEIVGISKDQIVGFDLSRGLNNPNMKAALDQCLSGNSGAVEGTYNNLFLKVDFNPVRNDRGRVTGGIGILEEITEKKRLQEKLLQIQKLESLGVLAGGIAHDFNNLLSIILGNISLAQDEATSNPHLLEVLSEAEKASLKASQLTRQFITFSSGGSPLREPLDFRRLIEDVANMTAGDSGVEVRLALPDIPLPVAVDNRQIAQVLINVLENAIEAMPQGGVVQISAGRGVPSGATLPEDFVRDELIWVSVEDNGKGISKKDLPRIMDPYFSTKARGSDKGMGLGLATAYAILKKHDGDIHVTSTPGKGTRVTMALPTATEKEPQGDV